jgi:hypothetical protein
MLPSYSLVESAARDLARESAELHVAAMMKGFPAEAAKLNEMAADRLSDFNERERARHQDLVIDIYMTAVLEFAKAVAGGKFQREPWTDESDAGVHAYRDWLATLPEVSAFETPAPGLPAPDVTRPADVREVTQHYLELYRGQPCEVYAKGLFQSLLKWPGVETWQHFGQAYAIYEEFLKYRAGQESHVLIALMWVLSRLRSKQAGTWNDYHIARWLLGVKDEAQRRAAMVELHRRIHLSEPGWNIVATSAAWAVRSLRQQYPAFDAEFSAVACADCLTLVANPKPASAVPPAWPPVV